MRFSILFISVILSLSILFCSIFIFISDSTVGLAVLADEDQQGRVLGASDISVDMITGMSSNFKASFPASENKRSAPPKLKEGVNKIDLENIACLIMDKASGAVLLKQNENKVMPIASISKLATVLVFLEQKIDWETVYQVKTSDIISGGRNNIYAGEKIKLKDLFFLSLVGSDNSATQALAHATGMTSEQFVKRINEKFKELGLTNTHFDDLTGLSDANTSTALDVVKLAQAAFTKKEIREATLTKKYKFTDVDGRSGEASNTDELLDIFPVNGIKIVGGKTGFTTSAGYCFVGQFVDKNGHEIVSVVLGGPDINSRFEETKRLVHWTYDNYLW